MRQIVSCKSALRTSRGKPCSRVKFNWNKWRDSTIREQYQIELSNKFSVLQVADSSVPISQRYDAFENAVHEVAERLVGKHPPCGIPSWVSDETIKRKEDRDKAKRVFPQSQTTRTKVTWRKLNFSLNLSNERDRTEALHRQIDELCTSKEKGDYSTTWKVIHDISRKNRKAIAKGTLLQLLAQQHQRFSKRATSSCRTRPLHPH